MSDLSISQATDFPIKRMTLYKHGVGFFERRAKLSGEKVELSFRVEEMNDVLKSLTAIDWGGGRVLGIEYATPQSREERLAGCSIRLDDDRSLRDLLTGLRGRRVRLVLDQGEEKSGTLVGLDELPDRQPVDRSLVSLLLDEAADVQTVSLGRVQSVEILDERGVSDLRFFLQTALTQDDHRRVTIRLTPGEHDLSIGYIAPAPTWRVSYRLVGDDDSDGGPSALLQGWGIFDNRLEEDLEGISLSLVAGMPISFVYELYTPFMPERPEVEEESRATAAPLAFAEAEQVFGITAGDAPDAEFGLRGKAQRAALSLPSAGRAVSREALGGAAEVMTEGESLGELFQYAIRTPVTVERGHSAMVPILSTDLIYSKVLLYNGRKMPNHPVATLRLKNETNLTLERGPVTVIEGGEYVGEAVLPFTVTGGDVIVPYAVELGIKIREEAGSKRQIRGLQVKGAYLLVEEWDVRWRVYQLNNSSEKESIVLVEHPRTAQYELFETPEPKERTDEHERFEVGVPQRGEAKLKVQARRLVRRREELQKQSYQGLQRYLQQGLLDQDACAKAGQLLGLWERISENQDRLKRVDQDRKKVFEAQTQIQGNLGALSVEGKEGALRARYVEQLESKEDRLRVLEHQELDLRAEIEQLKQEIQDLIKALD